MEHTFFTYRFNATCRYNFTDVPWKEVGQSIVLRDSLSLGQFALLKSSVSIWVDGGLSSDFSGLYLGQWQVLKYLHKIYDDHIEKCLRQ